MTSLPHSSNVGLSEAEDLMRAGNSEAAVEILRKIVEREAHPQALFMLASSYLELGNMTKHFATPRPRWRVNPPLRQPEMYLRK